MALLTDGPRSASVVAMEAGSAQVITRHSLDRELPSDGWIKALVSAIAERYRELDEELRTQRDPPIESD
jgi:CRP-like cAMP-binding protein